MILLDARRDLVGARSLCRLIETTGKEAPCSSSPTRAAWPRCRPTGASTTCCSRPPDPPRRTSGSARATPTVAANVDPVIQSGNIVIDEAGYSAKLNGVQLDLTYTEFELL